MTRSKQRLQVKTAGKNCRFFLHSPTPEIFPNCVSVDNLMIYGLIVERNPTWYEMCFSFAQVKFRDEGCKATGAVVLLIGHGVMEYASATRHVV